MKNEQLLELIDLMVRGEATESQREELQAVLKEDAEARRLFRQRMDLEIGLRTIILEQPDKPLVEQAAAAGILASPEQNQNSSSTILYFAVGLAGCMMVVATILLLDRWKDGKENRTVVEERDNKPLDAQPKELSESSTGPTLGAVLSQSDARWLNGPDSEILKAGPLRLESGVAEVQFDSGTRLIMEAPCELLVTSHESAKLVRGNLFVNVSELSNGFVLETEDARILDEGTEYAVSLNDDHTEVHVFDGSVVWSPNHSKNPAIGEELIQAGTAFVFEGKNREKAKRIPFGQRQFVRHLEFEVQKQGGDALRVYDGFENLAGRIRRGRSGIGWDGGWRPAGRGRRSSGEIVDCPNDDPFGFERLDRRELKLTDGSIRRLFADSLELNQKSPVFVSFLFTVTDDIGSWSARMSLEEEVVARRRWGQNAISFGFSKKGFPFLNSGRVVNKTASIMNKGIFFCVVKVSKKDQATAMKFRVYPLIAEIDSVEPSTWTVEVENNLDLRGIKSIRLVSEGAWMIDELKLGHSWEAVTRLAK